MDWTLFWTAFGAIGGTVGALATASAVIVALWQTKFAYKKKLKLSFDDNTKIVDNNGKIIADFISLTVTNIGNRDLIIKRWGFSVKNNREMQIFSDIPSEHISIYIRDAFVTKFPYTLPVEHEVTLYYEKDLFSKVIPECIDKKELDGNKPIEFFVKDSTGQKYTVKTKMVAKKYCI